MRFRWIDLQKSEALHTYWIFHRYAVKKCIHALLIEMSTQGMIAAPTSGAREEFAVTVNSPGST
jgi:hypothetical protein